MRNNRLPCTTKRKQKEGCKDQPKEEQTPEETGGRPKSPNAVTKAGEPREKAVLRDSRNHIPRTDFPTLGASGWPGWLPPRALPPARVGRRNRSLALLSYLLARTARSPPRRGCGGRQRATKGFALLNWDRLYRFTTHRGSPAPAPVEIGADGQRKSGSQPFTY